MLLLQSFLELPLFGCLAIAHGNNWTIFGDQDMDQKTCSKSPKLEIRPRHTKVTEEVEWSCCLVDSDRTKYFLVEYFARVVFWGVLQYPQIPWHMCQCRRNELTSLSMLCYTGCEINLTLLQCVYMQRTCVCVCSKSYQVVVRPCFKMNFLVAPTRGMYSTIWPISWYDWWFLLIICRHMPIIISILCILGMIPIWFCSKLVNTPCFKGTSTTSVPNILAFKGQDYFRKPELTVEQWPLGPQTDVEKVTDMKL